MDPIATADAPRLAAHRPLGLPVIVIAGLAVLAAVRGVLHDFTTATDLRPLNLALVLVPLVVWVAVAVIWSHRPLVSLLAAGAGYGLALAAIHLVAAPAALDRIGFAGIELGGRLSGLELPAAVETPLIAGAIIVSSVATGLIVGLVGGLVALLLRRFPAIRRRAPGAA